jgi:hypothetical protein
MSLRARIVSALLIPVPLLSAADNATQTVSLIVPPGAALRLYLTKKVSKRLGAPVQAKLMEPLYAFDHEVVPAGADVVGHVSRVQPVPGRQRFSAVLGGDFTPLHRAQVQFDAIVMPGGKMLWLHTLESPGLGTIYAPKPAAKTKSQPAPSPNGGVLGTARRTVHDQISTRIHNASDVVRGPDKKERLVDYLMAKLPYHPQWLRKGTRFDAELRDPLPFGPEPVAQNALALLGTQPAADSAVHARLVTALDSHTATKGQEVEAVVTEPLFSPTHQLIIPEGTRLTGSVVLVKRARWLHRGGQLRFNFQRVDLPEEAIRLEAAQAAARTRTLTPSFRTQAILQSAEAGGKTKIKVDQEGGVKATESKTRFLAPVISVMIANRSADNDAVRHNGVATGATDPNVGGRTLGGASGFGLLGTAAAQTSPYVGMAFGFYGMAWSVYSNLLARGAEVQFNRNAVIDIKFGARPPAGSAKFQGD